MTIAYQTQTDFAVDCRNLTKSFGSGDSKVFALRGVDLTVQRGELTLLVGPSGCGKTTLISVIAGILRPDAGNCDIFGTNMFKLPASQAISFRGKNIGFIFQSYNLLPALTIAENVAIPLIIKGDNRFKALDKARAILAEVGLGDRWRSMPAELSGGQQQRVAIARALVHEPGLIVCDEPTSALDHVTGGHIMELMQRAVRERNATLIIVTHDNRIFKYADRIAHMDDGQIVGFDDDHTHVTEDHN